MITKYYIVFMMANNTSIKYRLHLLRKKQVKSGGAGTADSYPSLEISTDTSRSTTDKARRKTKITATNIG